MDRFNQQVLVCQEKAFTMAFWLLGDEALACEVLQKVVLRVYCGWRNDEGNLVTKVLQGVIGFCRQAKPSETCTTNELTGLEPIGAQRERSLAAGGYIGKFL